MCLSWVPQLSFFKGRHQGVNGEGSASTFPMWFLVASGPFWLWTRDISSLHLALSIGKLSTWQLASLLAGEIWEAVFLQPNLRSDIPIFLSAVFVRSQLLSPATFKGDNWGLSKRLLLTVQGGVFLDTKFEESFGCSVTVFRLQLHRSGSWQTIGKQLCCTRHYRARLLQLISLQRISTKRQPQSREQSLGSVGYFNEHFKRSLHHLFCFLIINPHSCGCIIKSEILAKCSKCLSSLSSWSYTKFPRN